MKVSAALVTVSAALAAAAVTPSRVQARGTSSSSGDLPAVTVKGNAFFAGNERFYIRGVDYQPGGSSDAEDPIADVKTCKRDIAEFKKLGINTVRVYTVDNSADHDECMSLLAAAGIYLALDVNTPKYSLNRAGVHASYNFHYLQSIFATIDAFAGYSNTLLFFSGNEVINDDNTTDCAPYVKAVTRDMKQYIRSRGYRSIPVGYSAADVESNRYEMAQYMNCGSDDMRSDFFAFNDYSWCDPSSFTTSGWDKKVELFQNYSIPIFLSEYGCNTNKRAFEEVASLYSSDMTAVYSGGLVYEYAEEDNNYGLVKLGSGTPVEKADFAALKTAFAKAKAPTGDGGYQTSNQPATCPSASSTWQVTDFTGDELPTMPSGATAYLRQGAGKGPGLSGSGSQTAGGESSGTTKSGNSSSGATPSSAAQSITLAGGVGVAPAFISVIVALSTLLGTQLL